jgi:hypothetical protein
MCWESEATTWTYTLYALHIFLSEGWKNDYKSKIIKIDDFNKFVFDNLWAKHMVSIASDEEELQRQLKIMEKIGYLKIENDSITITEEQARTLKNIAYSIKYNTMRQRIPYIDLYLGRIEKAFVEEEK